jgi:multidrug efflux pump subunit AcrA (membrane-fusion protein)
MKRLINLVIILLVLSALGWALWRGFTHRPAQEGEAAKTEEGAAPEEEKPEAFTVALEKEKWKALGVEKDTPEAAELRPRRISFGRVLDPTPLVTLDDDLASAEAALAASRAEYERSQKLLAAGENTSRKNAETAEAQFRADEIKASGLQRRALLEWGPAFAVSDPGARRTLIDKLVKGSVSLVRLDLLPGDALPEEPKRAVLLALGREKEPIVTDSIAAAADVDPKTQAQGYLLRVENAPFPLRPGMALTGWLELPEAPRAGFAVPRSAVLRHDGRTWVYVQEEEEKFLRKPVTLDSPLEGEKGWFVDGQTGGIGPDDLLVVTGAESLLSEELKAQGGGEPD